MNALLSNSADVADQLWQVIKIIMTDEIGQKVVVGLLFLACVSYAASGLLDMMQESHKLQMSVLGGKP